MHLAFDLKHYKSQYFFADTQSHHFVQENFLTDIHLLTSSWLTESCLVWVQAQVMGHICPKQVKAMGPQILYCLAGQVTEFIWRGFEKVFLPL